MAHDFIPRRDADFVQWSSQFSTNINADYVQLGLTQSQAAEYASLHAAFASAYQAAHDPERRTSPNILRKTIARQAAEREARRLARIIQATAGVTAAQRRELSLTVRDIDPSPVGRPTESPRVFLKLLHGSTIRVTLRSADSPRRGKPDGVAGAMVFSFVGNVPPDSLEQWKLEGGTTRTTMDITFGPNVPPGSMVWVTAYWTNPRAQRGPAAQPRSTHIQCPTLIMPGQSLRLAA